MKAKSFGECLPSSGQEPETGGKLNALLLGGKGWLSRLSGKRNQEMNKRMFVQRTKIILDSEFMSPLFVFHFRHHCDNNKNGLGFFFHHSIKNNFKNCVHLQLFALERILMCELMLMFKYL